MKLNLPTHEWERRVIGGYSVDVCKFCGVSGDNLPYYKGPASRVCVERVEAWGHRMREAGAEVERSAIVRHLIDRAEDVRSSPAVMDFTNQLATEIESGDHNKEE